MELIAKIYERVIGRVYEFALEVYVSRGGKLLDEKAEGFEFL